jgi:hypothetical protein
LPGAIEVVRDEGDAARFDRESRYRWVLHRLRIAVSNEALAGTTADQDLRLAAWRIAHMPNSGHCLFAYLCASRSADRPDLDHHGGDTPRRVLNGAVCASLTGEG